jgi:pimeloyl-ACP methyl ester carboxylesterase
MTPKERRTDGLKIRFAESGAGGDAIRDDYLDSYVGDRFVRSAAYMRAYPTDLPVLVERLGEIRTPVQIIAGRRYVLVPPSKAEFLRKRLPDSKPDILDTGHFTWGDDAEDHLRLTSAWINPNSMARSGG